MVREKEGGGREEKMRDDGEVSLGIEDFIPSGKAKKALWVRGVDMLSYSVNSLQLTNLKFKYVKSPRSSEVVRLQLNQDDTESLLAVSGYLFYLPVDSVCCQYISLVSITLPPYIFNHIIDGH